MKPGVFQGKKFPFTPKRRKKSLGSQCNNIIDTHHDLAAFRSKLANVSWLLVTYSSTLQCPQAACPSWVGTEGFNRFARLHQWPVMLSSCQQDFTGPWGILAIAVALWRQNL